MESGVPVPKKILRFLYTICFWRYSAIDSVVQKYFIVSGTLTLSSSQSLKKASIVCLAEKTMAV